MDKKIKLFHREAKVKVLLEVLAIYVILALVLSGLYNFVPVITGSVTVSKEFSYSDDLNLILNGSSDYTWILNNPGKLKNIKVSGTIENKGSARIYVENKGVKYLIFDSNKLNEKDILDKITGFIAIDAGNNIVINDTSISNITNQTKNETPTIGVIANKTITINLDYKAGSIYDVDDDGIETTTGIVDFTVENSKFNWGADESKLCTRWDTYSTKNSESTTVCYGSSDCCSLVNLKPIRVDWEEVFYSYYGLYGATLNNVVSAQVIYADYNLSVDDPYSEIIYSDWVNLSEEFYTEVITFDSICVDTCILFDFNDTSYRLIFEVNSTVLILNEINYIIEKGAIVNNPPILIKNISNLKIDESLTIDLNEYFKDIDNDVLSFSYYPADNVIVIIENNIATIIPDKGYEGTIHLFFTANDSYETAVSNVFSIDIVKKLQKIEKTNRTRIVINRPVKWLKKVILDELQSNVSINITSFATNITVRKIEDNIAEEIPEEKLKIIDKGVIKELKEYEIDKEIEKIEKEKNKETNLDRIKEIQEKIDELEQEKDQIINSKEQNQITGAITGLAITDIPKIINDTTVEIIAQENISTEIIIEELVGEVEIEYYTEGPVSEEIKIDNNRKRIIISSDIHYEDILAFTTLSIEAASEAIKLYWLVNNSRIEVSVDKFDTNDNGLVDYIEWNVPYLSNQTYELSITILNVQSFPTLNGNWTVRFNTTGTGNLTISASNGTTYSELYLDNGSTINDLTTLELKCDNNILFNYYDQINNENIYLINEYNEKIRLSDTINKNVIIRSIYAENYNCSGLGYWTVKVITEGVHTQQFNFSDQIAYAFNTVSSETCDSGTPDTLCVINTIHGVTNNSVLYYNSLLIQNGGGLRNQTATAVFNISVTNLTIEDGGFIEGNVNINASNLTIVTGGIINLTGRGFAGATVSSANGDGPGAGQGDSADGGQGAGYGGIGGDGNLNTNTKGSSYGSITKPVDLGSGGGAGFTTDGGDGGGAIFINVTDTLNVTGNIFASGAKGVTATTAGGGGSGGSIYIVANTFVGNGTINASGGSGGDDNAGDTDGGGGGAGGRIAIYYTTKTFDGPIQAFGGFSTDAREGGAGTIFLKQDSENGDLIISNNNNFGNTPIAENITLGSFNISKGANVSINKTITVSTTIVNISKAWLTISSDSVLNTSRIEMDTGLLSNYGGLNGSPSINVNNGTNNITGSFNISTLTIMSGAVVSHLPLLSLNITAVRFITSPNLMLDNDLFRVAFIIGKMVSAVEKLAIAPPLMLTKVAFTARL